MNASHLNAAMLTFIGTKQVRAVPMNRRDYNLYRGWEVPADEDPSDHGYLVEYLDGGKANHPAHAGYISWSPSDVFERAYRAIPAAAEGLPPYQARVVIEHASTLERFGKLTAFIASPAFAEVPRDEQERMKWQAQLMSGLVECLSARIANFAPPAET